jgi:hypothetical protein
VPKKRIAKIPDQVLAQVNEWSSGGFLLFTFDEYGNPQINSNFDSQSHAASMQYYVSNWVKAIDVLNLAMVSNAINQARRKKS